MPINISGKKERILELVKERGPSLPIKLSKEIGLSLLLTSALLSELVADKELQFTKLKIGGSPLYFQKGQEKSLEEYVSHLPAKEKETVNLLKEKRFVVDASLEPSNRVAIRNLSDFAIKMSVKLKDGEKIFWRYFDYDTDEAKGQIKELLSEKPKVEERKPIFLEAPKIEEKEPEVVEELEEEKPIEPKIDKKTGEKLLHQVIKKVKPVKKVIKKVNKKKQEFLEAIERYFEIKDFGISERFEDEEKIAVVSTDTPIGKMKFLVIGKNKKAITESDLVLAYQEGQHMRLPVLFLSPGNLSKKVDAYLEKLGSLILVEKVKV
ncbi:MAG: hypothetical protein ABH817_01970 [archaeon]